jgi:hypothetical protein
MQKIVCALTVASLTAAPVSASVRDAAFASSADNHASRTAMFIGASYRVGLHPKDKARNGRVSLKLSGMTMTPGSAEIRFGQGLELTGGQSGKPALFVAGQDVRELQKQTQLSSGGKIAVAAGVVVLLGAVAFGIWALDATYCDRNDCE